MQYIMKLVIAILILAIVLIAGCTQLNSIACKPNWVLGYQGPAVSNVVTDDVCKAQCYAANKVTSHKIENTTTMQSCYCDVNNCNP